MAPLPASLFRTIPEQAEIASKIQRCRLHDDKWHKRIGTEHAVEAFGGEGLSCIVSILPVLSLMVLPLLSAGLPALYYQSEEASNVDHDLGFQQLDATVATNRALWLDIFYPLCDIVRFQPASLHLLLSCSDITVHSLYHFTSKVNRAKYSVVVLFFPRTSPGTSQYLRSQHCTNTMLSYTDLSELTAHPSHSGGQACSSLAQSWQRMAKLFT